MRKKKIYFSLRLAISILILYQTNTSAQNKPKALSNNCQKIDYYNQLAENQITVNKDSSYYYAKIANDMALECHYMKGLMISLRKIGLCQVIDGDFIKASDSYHKSLEIARSLKDTSNIIPLLKDLALTNFYNYNHSEGLSYLLEGIKLSEVYKNDSLELVTNLILVKFYIDNCDKDETFKFCKKLFLLAWKKNSPEYVAISIYNFADYIRSISLSNKNILQLYNLSLIIAKKNKLPETEAAVYLKKAEYYYQIKQSRKSIENGNLALNTIKNAHKNMLLSGYLTKLGHLYGVYGDYKKELFYQKKAFEVRSQHKYRNTAYCSLVNIGFCYFKLKRYDEALMSIQEAITYFKKINSIIYLKSSYKKLYEVYDEKKDYNNAFKALDSYIYYKSKLDSISDKTKVFRIQKRYDDALNQLEVDKKELKNEQMLHKLSKILLALSSLVIILITFLFIIRTKNRNRLLTLNSQLEEKFKERTKELIN